MKVRSAIATLLLLVFSLTFASAQDRPTDGPKPALSGEWNVAMFTGNLSESHMKFATDKDGKQTFAVVSSLTGPGEVTVPTKPLVFSVAAVTEVDPVTTAATISAKRDGLDFDGDIWVHGNRLIALITAKDENGAGLIVLYGVRGSEAELAGNVEADLGFANLLARVPPAIAPQLLIQWLHLDDKDTQ